MMNLTTGFRSFWVGLEGRENVAHGSACMGIYTYVYLYIQPAILYLCFLFLPVSLCMYVSVACYHLP